MTSRILEHDSSTLCTKENVLDTVILIFPRRACIVIMLYLRVRWDSSVDIVTGCGLDGRGSVSNRGKRYSLFHSTLTSSGVHTVSYFMGTEGCFLGSKMAGE
jgi:hypothetical protein